MEMMGWRGAANGPGIVGAASVLVAQCNSCFLPGILMSLATVVALVSSWVDF